MKNGIHGLLALAILACLTLFVVPPLAMPQDDLRILEPEQLKPHSRPPATFIHDEHNEKAKIDDCAACHHGKTKDGKQDRDDMTAGTPCAECHASDAAEGTPLKRAYHQQCINCHRTENKGPTYCGGCHKE